MGENQCFPEESAAFGAPQVKSIGKPGQIRQVRSFSGEASP